MEFNINRRLHFVKTVILIALFLINDVAAIATPTNTSLGSPDTEALDKMMQTRNSDSLMQEEDRLDYMEHIEESKSRIAWQQYYRENLFHRRNTFNWQYNSGIIIFYVVIMVVLSGIIYSGVQFYQSIREMRVREKMLLEKAAINLQIMRELRLATSNTEENESNALYALPAQMLTDTKTEVELSAKGIKLTSSLIGVVILVISIAFFYLYLIYVYPIDQLKIDVEQQRQEMMKTNQDIEKK